MQSQRGCGTGSLQLALRREVGDCAGVLGNGQVLRARLWGEIHGIPPRLWAPSGTGCSPRGFDRLAWAFTGFSSPSSLEAGRIEKRLQPNSPFPLRRRAEPVSLEDSGGMSRPSGAGRMEGAEVERGGESGELPP